MPITINVDITGAIQEARIAQRQIPFIAAKTLTDTAKGAQQDTRSSLKSRSAFTLRNAWTSDNIRIKPATKTVLIADVHTDFSRRASATDYLALQEDAYVKVSDHSFLCIPTDALYALAGGSQQNYPRHA
jgi:phage repressor protein C with HTH and peptisase S24 domain